MIVTAREALADNHGMCLTIPKKVISRAGDFFVVENPGGTRQKVKSVIECSIGDYVVTYGGIIIEITDKIQSKDIENKLMKIKKGGNK